jgi:hypothetical protein
VGFHPKISHRGVIAHGHPAFRFRLPPRRARTWAGRSGARGTSFVARRARSGTWPAGLATRWRWPGKGGATARKTWTRAWCRCPCASTC